MKSIYEKRRKDIGVVSTVVYDRNVSCDGQFSLHSQEVHHPKVYYRIENDTNQVTCGYCNKTFIYIEADL